MIALDDLLAAGGDLHGPITASSFADWCYDSRLATPGACFVALRTRRADGHDYIPAALAAGVTGILCHWPPADAGTATVIVTDDPEALLQRWAARRLADVAPTVVTVTGSVGKTTARRAVGTMLEAQAPTFQSRRSFNSLLGLPISLARLERRHRYAVLEFGSDRPGEIARLANLFPPRVAVVTNVGEAHSRGFGTLEAVAAELRMLIQALPTDGVAVLNGDDPLVAALAAAAPRVITYGMRAGCDLRADLVHCGLDGTRMRVRWEGDDRSWAISGDRAGSELLSATDRPAFTFDRSPQQLWLPLLGEPAVYAALAAVAATIACGLDPTATPLAELEPAAGRLRPLPGAGGATIIDDSFSASPPSARAALRTLASLPARRRIAVLGAFSDLRPGAESQFYDELGELAAYAVDTLVCKGDWGVTVARSARAKRPNLAVAVVDTAEAAVAALPNDLGPGDLVLVKGGAEARMERVVGRLMASSGGGDGRPAPTTSHQLLVRQESAWHSVRIGDPDRPTWLKVDLDAIANNVRLLRGLANVPVMVVLKSDGYGHGAVRVARAALGAGATAVAVATLGEGRALREQEIRAPVLILGYIPPWQVEEVVRLGLDCTLFDDETARALNDAALAHGGQARVHVKVDTGMARLGLHPDATGPFLTRLRAMPGLDVTGLYTHFASADDENLRSAELQLTRFTTLLGELERAGLRPPIAHAANSAATLRLPPARLDMVRPGIACYGLAPAAAVPLPPGFAPALSFHSEVAQVKEHNAGTPISYGGTFVTPHVARIATIPAGYADGLRRNPPWRAVLIKGQRAPIVGRICMDYVMADVTTLPGVRRGDAVVLIGSQGTATITADEVAEWLGTISYEVLAGILPRVPREVSG